MTSFKEGGCKVALPGSDESSGAWICLSGTKYQKKHSFNEKLCDLLFGWEQASGTKVSAPIELKGGHVDVSHVRLQLQHGADILDELLKDVKVATFLPVLVHGTISSAEKRMLLDQKILFRGRRSLITRVPAVARIGALRW